MTGVTMLSSGVYIWCKHAEIWCKHANEYISGVSMPISGVDLNMPFSGVSILISGVSMLISGVTYCKHANISWIHVWRFLVTLHDYIGRLTPADLCMQVARVYTTLFLDL